MLTSEITFQIQKLLKLFKQIKDLVFKKRKVFNAKNQKKGISKESLIQLPKKRPILITSNLKLKVKINKKKPAITILNSKAKINVITCKATNKFDLAIK